MTSRVSFCKVMIQDLRHRIWMLALSCLGSFLAMPVFYLLVSKNWTNQVYRWSENIELWAIRQRKLELLHEFYVQSLPITCGFILGAGALIVGIFGFRHVFSKKMVDQFHSIPIKRRDLFLANYLNGFLIWFVPMAIGAVCCGILSAFFTDDMVDWMVYVIKPMGMMIGNLVLAFLLIYHVAIVAVMMSGNVLNTLVNGTIINFVVILLYCMIEIFSGIYFDTYYSFFVENINYIYWTSPICSAIYQLYMFAMEKMLVFPVVMNVIMVIALFGLGFWLYMRRPSELAEQGMKIKPLQLLFKTCTTVLAGLAGWGIFYLLTESLAWQIFGTILASVLCYGILDIIFYMDFKAFFAHKIELVTTVVASILVGCMFFFDWIGFDAYMPQKDKIAEIGLYVHNLGFSNSSGNFDDDMSIESRINRMSYKNSEVIYDLLEVLTERDGNYPTEGSSQNIYVRVKEKNGKTYYRCYRLWATDEELILPILKDESYIRNNVLIPQNLIDNVKIVEKSGNVELESNNQYWYVEEEAFVKDLMKAYNEDIMANPDLFIYQNDKVLANLFYRDSTYRSYFRIDLYESMEHVKEVLRKYDYQEVLKKVEAEDVKSIQIRVYTGKYSYETLKSALGLEEIAKDIVKEKQSAAEITYVVAEDGPTSEYKTEVAVEAVGVEAYDLSYEYNATFTDAKDIAELLEIMEFNTPNFRSMFRPRYSNADIHIEMKNGESYYVQMKAGIFPEKFLEYFDVISYQ